MGAPDLVCQSTWPVNTALFPSAGAAVKSYQATRSALFGTAGTLVPDSKFIAATGASIEIAGIAIRVGGGPCGGAGTPGGSIPAAPPDPSPAASEPSLS